MSWSMEKIDQVIFSWPFVGSVMALAAVAAFGMLCLLVRERAEILNEVDRLRPMEQELKVIWVEKELSRLRSRGIGGVYFVQGLQGGPIKIGRSENIGSRISNLQTSNPHTLRPLVILRGSMIEACKAEKLLHERFGHLRMSGEWFQPGNDLLAYLEELKSRRDEQ